jgi:hypothetical protein
MRFWLVPILALALPVGSGAATWDFGCDSDTANDVNHTIQPATGASAPVQSHRACFTFTDADATTTSAAFQVVAATALACFDPDTAATNTSAARVKIRRCPAGTKPGSSPGNECLALTRGVYYADVTVACAAGDFCRVTVEGE